MLWLAFWSTLPRCISIHAGFFSMPQDRSGECLWWLQACPWRARQKFEESVHLGIQLLKLLHEVFVTGTLPDTFEASRAALRPEHGQSCFELCRYLAADEFSDFHFDLPLEM